MPPTKRRKFADKPPAAESSSSSRRVQFHSSVTGGLSDDPTSPLNPPQRRPEFQRRPRSRPHEGEEERTGNSSANVPPHRQDEGHAPAMSFTSAHTMPVGAPSQAELMTQISRIQDPTAGDPADIIRQLYGDRASSQETVSALRGAQLVLEGVLARVTEQIDRVRIAQEEWAILQAQQEQPEEPRPSARQLGKRRVP